jgi:cytochrome c-type biogenesis protein CcmE
MHGRTLKILLTVAIVGGGIGYLLFSSVQAEVSYYKHVEEVMARPEAWTAKPLQVHGFVEAGSVQKRIEGHQQKTDFVLESKGQRLLVTTFAPTPDTFKDTAEVVASGTLTRREDGTYLLEATELTAKCPSKYEENRRTQNLAGPG